MVGASPTTRCPEATSRVDSREEWNDTGFDVVAGHAYRYSAEGVWRDAFITTNADGFDRWYMWPLRAGRRVKGQPWFRLIAMVDRRTLVVLGTRGEFRAPASGRLFCFANDWRSARWNNRGCVCLRIETV